MSQTVNTSPDVYTQFIVYTLYNSPSGYVEDTSLPISYLSYLLHLNIHVYSGTSFTFTLMTTGAFTQNVGELFFELKLVTDNVFILILGLQ